MVASHQVGGAAIPGADTIPRLMRVPVQALTSSSCSTSAASRRCRVAAARSFICSRFVALGPASPDRAISQARATSARLASFRAATSSRAARMRLPRSFRYALVLPPHRLFQNPLPSGNRSEGGSSRQRSSCERSAGTSSFQSAIAISSACWLIAVCRWITRPSGRDQAAGERSRRDAWRHYLPQIAARPRLDGQRAGARARAHGGFLSGSVRLLIVWSTARSRRSSHSGATALSPMDGCPSTWMSSGPSTP